MRYGIDYFKLIFQFDCYQLQLAYQTVERYPARNFQLKTSPITFDTTKQSQHLHTLHKFFFFLHFSCVFTFLELIKYNRLKMFFSFFKH